MGHDGHHHEPETPDAGHGGHEHHTGPLPHRIPDFGALPGRTTRVAVQSGPWSAPATWGGTVPIVEEIARIPHGVTVTLDTLDAQAHVLLVSGRLVVSPEVDTSLLVGTLVVLPDGALVADLSQRPERVAEIVFADVPLDVEHDPDQWGTGLIGLGRVHLHGVDKTPFVRLAVEPQKGDRTLTVEAPVEGWRVGDAIELPNSQQLAANVGKRGSESFTVQAVSDDGLTVTLNKAVALPHPGAYDADGETPTTVPWRGGRRVMPYVANTTRNILLRSANPQGTRAHAVFVARADVDIRGAEFAHMGRTTMAALHNTSYHEDGSVKEIGRNQIGKYAVHFHHCFGPVNDANEGYQFVFAGNAIHDGLKWGLSVHETHYGYVGHNVVCRTQGWGIGTEGGSESFNVFEHNFCFDIRGGTSIDFKDGRASDPFWFHSPTNYVRHNVAANGAWGYSVFMQDMDGGILPITVRVPKFRGADIHDDAQVDLVKMREQPVLEWRDNEAYCCRDGGLNVWSLGESNPKGQARSTFADSLIWHCEYNGVDLYIAHHVLMDGLVIRGDVRALAGSSKAQKFVMNRGYGFLNQRASYKTWLRRVDIQGMRTGIYVPRETSESRDGYGPFVIEDGYLACHRNVYLNVHTSAHDQSDRQVYVSRVRHGAIAGTRAADGEHLDWLFVRGESTVSRSLQFYVLHHDGEDAHYQLYWPGQDVAPIDGVQAPAGTTVMPRSNDVLARPIAAVPLPDYGAAPDGPPPPPPPPPPPEEPEEPEQPEEPEPTEPAPLPVLTVCVSSCREGSPYCAEIAVEATDTAELRLGDTVLSPGTHDITAVGRDGRTTVAKLTVQIERQA